MTVQDKINELKSEIQEYKGLLSQAQNKGRAGMAMDAMARIINHEDHIFYLQGTLRVGVAV